jgi:hypothetical protein
MRAVAGYFRAVAFSRGKLRKEDIYVSQIIWERELNRKIRGLRQA